MSAELLPARFPTEDAARRWSTFITRHEVVGIVPSTTKAGYWQVKIRRQPTGKAGTNA